MVDYHEQEHAHAGPLQGTGHVKNTHVAIALCAASGVADVGAGVEAAALQVELHFVP